MRKWIPVLLIVMAMIASVIVYPQLPEQMPTHWNMRGEVDGSSSRLFGAWMVPLMMAVIWLIMRALPHIDPRRANDEKFATMYEALIIVTLAFMLGLHFVLLAMAMGTNMDMNRIVIASVGAFFGVIGFLLPKAHPNWFVGIRTPWTLTSDAAWERTHRMGGPLFMLIGALTVVASLAAPKMAVWVLTVSTVAVTVFLFVYSYRVWKEDGHRRSAI